MRDLWFAARFLSKRPSWTLVAVSTLAIGTGAFGLAVSTLDESFWRPLAFEDPSSLITIYETRGGTFQPLSYPDFSEHRAQGRTVFQLAAFMRIFATVNGGRQPIRATGEMVSGEYFAILGAKPYLGRLLDRVDDQFGVSEPVVVLGYEFWRQEFGADPGILGQGVLINRVAHTVVGVTSSVFESPAWPSVFWVPIAVQPLVMPSRADMFQAREIPWLQTVGRLIGDNTLRTAQSRVELVGQRRETSDAKQEQISAPQVFPASYLRFWPGARPQLANFLGILVTLAGSVLLIACANLIMLLLVRSEERSWEIAVRQVLGAGPRQVARRIVSEVALLVGAAGIVGAGSVLWASRFVEILPLPIPFSIGLSANFRTFFLSLLAPLGAGVVMCVAVTLGIYRRSLFRDPQRTLTRGNSHSRFLKLSVVVQIALTCVLLIGAGLLFRSARQLQAAAPSFEIDRRLMALIVLPSNVYPEPQVSRYYTSLLEALRREPAIESAGLEWIAVLGQIRSTTMILVEGSSTMSADEPMRVKYNLVSPGYFETLGIALHAGRDFARRDNLNSPLVAVVNRTFATRLWGGTSVLGARIKRASDDQWATVVGIVSDIKYNDLAEGPEPFVYFPLAQLPRVDVYVHLRSSSEDAMSVLPLLREAVARLDPEVPVAEPKLLSEQVKDALSTSRVIARISALFAMLATVLAVTGVYGMSSYSSAQRAGELSIRYALGATPKDLGWEVLVPGAKLALTGASLGTAGALVLSRFLDSLLYGIEAYDPATFIVVPTAVILTSVASCWGTYRHAASFEPTSSSRVAQSRLW